MMNPYYKFILMLAISFIAMYVLMYLNVNDTSHIYLSATRMYMTILMVAAMAIIMVLMMPQMYPNKKANGGIISQGDRGRSREKAE